MTVQRLRPGYLVAIAISLLAFGLRYGLTPMLGERSVFLLFLLGAVIAAGYAGLGPGLLATGLGFCFGNAILASQHVPLFDVTHVIGDVSYLAIGVAISWSSETLHVLRRRLESQSDRLKQRDAFHAAIADLGSDFAVSMRTETDGEPAVEEVIGGVTRVLGLTLADLAAPAGWRALLPSDPAIADDMSAKIRAGVPVDREAWVASREGHLVLLRISTRPETDRHGRPVRTYLAAQDVTRERESEAQLRSVWEQLRIVTDSMSVPVSRLSRDLRYLWASRSYGEWHGLDIDAIVGHALADVLGQESLEAVLPYVERVLAGEAVQFEEPILYRGVERRRVRAMYSPTYNRDGQVDGWVSVLVDIEEDKRREQELRDADRRKDEFLATLAHELRNPLAPIRNALQILTVAGTDEAHAAQARAIMTRQLAQMVRLIDDLLDVSRVTRNVLELRREPMPIGDAILDALETSRPVIDAASHSVTVHIPDEPLIVDGDGTRLAQVFSNLLNNAAKFMDPGGCIEVDASREGDHAIVSIRDQGFGIPPSMQPTIFEMFTQVDSSIERSRGGLGVGLTIVKRLVEMHGGTVEVESNGAGTGSRFVVTLPLATQAKVDAPKAAKRDNGAASKLRVLVVDDNDDAAVSLAVMLRLQGHEASTAPDGLQALAAAASDPPDVVLLDIGLPGIDGYEVARRIRGEGWGKGVKLVALTGWGQDDDRHRSMQAGIDLHLVKPVAPELLEEMLCALQSGAAGTP